MAKELDLHGVRHYDVERLVENLVLLNDDWKIICGNSDMMIKIVEDKLNWLYDNHKIKWHRNTHNSFRSI
tara:strand:+ start:462 stop:671 length:210 start_codon:yes stop_codon:yes gene_type:complete